jgi:membrane peptidoglycan carboxypeptidase
VEAVDEDGMSSPDNGGGARGGLSGLAAGAGATTNDKASRERRANALERIGRYASFAALVGIVVAVGVHAGLQVAMSWMGPPPLQAVTLTHLVPSAANTDAPLAAVADVSADKQSLSHLPLAPEEVDPRYLAMLFAFEDRRFYSHYGVDPFGIARAARDLVWNQRIITGGSTLTMQVARLLDNQYQRTPSVKLRQIVRAFQLEQQLTKKEILSLYLGLAPFGGRVKGVRAASLNTSARSRASFPMPRPRSSSRCRRLPKRAALTATPRPPGAPAISCSRPSLPPAS